MLKALYPRDDIDYMSRKGGRGFTNIEHSVDSSIQRFKEYIKKEQRNPNYSTVQQ